MDVIYKELDKYENVVVQLNSNGNYTKRLKLDSLPDRNHRKIGIPELVFDIDCNEPSIAVIIWDSISNKLILDDISHSVWYTSRSYHIHSFFKGMELYDKETRKQLKRHMIKHYAGVYSSWLDVSKCNENQMIRDFEGKHETTGKLMKLVFKHENKYKTLLNDVNIEILNNFTKRYNSGYEHINISNTGSNELTQALKARLQGLIDFSIDTKFLQRGMSKNKLYFKNIAIAVYLLRYTQEQRKQIFRQVALNCKPHTDKNLESWYVWCKSQKHGINVNWCELKPFYSENVN